nr:biotin/lipoyl-binding protein [Rhizobium sp. P28RR-XV]
MSNGRIEAQQVLVSAKFAGRVADVLVEEGQIVDAEAIIARMDTSELNAQLSGAEAEVRRSETDSMTVHDLSEFPNYLPALLRGIFYENWHPAAAISACNGIEHVPATVAARLDCNESEVRLPVAEVFKLLELRANPFIAEKLRALPKKALSLPMSAGGTQPSYR